MNYGDNGADQESEAERAEFPLAGCDWRARNLGCSQPQVTEITICMGMKQMVRKATQLAKVGNANSAMKPSDTDITSSEETIPSRGCFTAPSFSVTGRSVSVSARRRAPPI